MPVTGHWTALWQAHVSFAEDLHHHVFDGRIPARCQFLYTTHHGRTRRPNLNEVIQFLIQHGYALLFAWVLVEQIGLLPVPAIPLLLAAGALAGSGKTNFVLAVGIDC